MSKYLVGIAVVLSASVGQAQPPSYTWNQTWDFNSGTQGWTLGGNASAKWVDPALEPNGPMLPDSDVSHGGAGNLYLPDQGTATLDVTALNLGNTVAGRNGFVMQVDVYIPNLRPLTGFNWNYPGNMNQWAGIGIQRAGDGKGPTILGHIENGANEAQDKSWDNTACRIDWSMEETVSPDTLWWNKWITLVLDYSYTTPGKFDAWEYVPWNSPVTAAGWHKLTPDGGRDCHPSDQFVNFVVGRARPDRNSWTQSQFDNVKLAYTPEPATLGLLLLGLPMVRRRHP